MIKFAGDALIIVWAAGNIRATTTSDLALHAIRCSLELHERLDELNGLRLHIGIGVGNFLFLQVGGVLSRWEFLVAGPALAHMSIAEAAATPGRVCVCLSTWALVSGKCSGQPTAAGTAIEIEGVRAVAVVVV